MSEEPNPTRLALDRSRVEFNKLPPGILVERDQTDAQKVHALIIGPDGTPYQGGFFYFLIECPPEYPERPPEFKLKTTDNGNVKFNPNFYKNGKIFLPALKEFLWSPATTLGQCLGSIRGLMNERPYDDGSADDGDGSADDGSADELESEQYNAVIRHETLRVAVCGMLEDERALDVPTAFRDAMKVRFLENYDYYLATATHGLELDGKMMQDPFSRMRIQERFCHEEILRRLQALERI